MEEKKNTKNERKGILSFIAILFLALSVLMTVLWLWMHPDVTPTGIQVIICLSLIVGFTLLIAWPAFKRIR